jgi:hypothetical protein
MRDKSNRAAAVQSARHIDEAASCGRFYTRRCVYGVSDPPEACKVSFLARLNMSSLRCPICMVDDECNVMNDEAASCGRFYTRRCV